MPKLSNFDIEYILIYIVGGWGGGDESREGGGRE